MSDQFQQIAKQYANQLLNREKSVNQILEEIKQQVSNEQDIINILKLIKKELEFSGKITIIKQKSYVTDEFKNLITRLNEIEAEIKNSNN